MDFCDTRALLATLPNPKVRLHSFASCDALVFVGDEVSRLGRMLFAYGIPVGPHRVFISDSDHDGILLPLALVTIRAEFAFAVLNDANGVAFVEAIHSPAARGSAFVLGRPATFDLCAS